MHHASALLTFQFELRHWARRQLRNQRIEALGEFQGSKHTNQHHQFATVSAFDSLQGALGNARLPREFGLRDARLDALALDALA
jgi:hypothetical protein